MKGVLRKPLGWYLTPRAVLRGGAPSDGASRRICSFIPPPAAIKAPGAHCAEGSARDYTQPPHRCPSLHVGQRRSVAPTGDSKFSPPPRVSLVGRPRLRSLSVWFFFLNPPKRPVRRHVLAELRGQSDGRWQLSG